MESIMNGHNSDQNEPDVNPDGFFNDLSSQNACSVRVAVRVRPLIGRELNEGGRTCVDVDEKDNKLIIGEKNFQFDRVFYSDAEQSEIFDVCARNLVLGCFSGFNATILAYGQTGSGKTHTMGTGSTNGLSEEQIGIVPRVFQFIFEELDRRKQQSSFSEFAIRIAFLELYNEELHDLLDSSSMGVDKMTGKPLKELQIKEKNGNIYVHNLKEEIVTSKEECLQLLNKGISHRTTSATLMNEGSSRSHAIFTITIEQKIVKEIEVPEGAEIKEGLPGQQEEQISAKFHFVDLAGSERIKRTGATGQLMKEGISINKGLLCLGNVISALTDENKKEKHIPYRDSKLTRILQDSLGGNSRTTMIACVSPAESNYEESLNSIKYASRARNIKNKPVVNRDPNSMLIDSLRQQITSLQGEITEYRTLLKSNNIDIPDNFTEKIQQKAQEQKKGPQKSQPNQAQSQNDISNSVNQGSINFSELRDIKIKLSRKEKELKDLQEQLQQLVQKVASKDQEISSLANERDTLRLKNEILNECLQKNNLQLDSQSDNADKTTLSLIDEYKQKLEKMEKELERKNQEIQNKNRNIAELQIQSQRDEEVLRKHLEENQRLKRQIKKFEDAQLVIPNSPSPPPSVKNISNKPNFKLNLQGLGNGSAIVQSATHANAKKDLQINTTDLESSIMKRRSQLDNIVLDAEDLNQKFINNLTSQLEVLFQPSMDEEINLLSSARSLKGSKILQNFDSDNLVAGSMEDMINNALQDSNNLLEDDNQAINPQVIEEKEKILGTVKTSVMQLQNELVELMKTEYEKKIENIEKDLRQMDTEKKATLQKTTDTKQIQQIEQQYKQKMDDLSKQLQNFKEKEKKQEQVQKQINVQEKKIKTLEDDITKMKTTKDKIEQQMKSQTEKFSKFQQNVSKELTHAKKAMNDKEKEVIKLKQDLKKTDQLAQKKISELRGFQKKVYEDRMKRDLEKKEEYERKGIDIERIKDWINENTERMLRHNDLKELLQKQMDDKDRIEDEMLQEGEKLTEIMLQKERKEIEKQQLELETEPDEGKILELEEELYQLFTEMNNITEHLDSLDQTLVFINKKVNSLTEEIIGLDIDNIQPLKFHGLESIDAARVTLQTFFCVLLDLNIYKRDLENKCIEQDEAVLDLTEKLSHKLEQALSDKEQYKLKFENLRKKNKNDAIVKDPLQFKEQEKEKNDRNQQQEKGEKDNNTKLPSLASARATRKFGLQNPPSSQQVDTTINTNEEGNSSVNTTMTTMKSQNQNTSGTSLKFRSRLNPAQKAATEESLNQLQAVKNQISRNKDQQTSHTSLRQQLLKKPQNQRKSSSLDREPIQEKLQKQNSSKMVMKRTPRKMDSFVGNTDSNFSSNNIQQTMQQKKLLTIPEVQAGKPKSQGKQTTTVVPSFKDRRNQRKLEHTTEEPTAVKVEPEKVFDIEKIKEETFMITHNQQHMERRQSRARAFSKKMKGRNPSSGHTSSTTMQRLIHGNIQAMNDFMENEEEESPRMSRTPNKLQSFQPQLNIVVTEPNDPDSSMIDAMPSPSKDIRNKWTYEELAQLENFGNHLIGCEYISNKIILIFDNFIIREVLIETLEETLPINVLEINGMQYQGELAVDFAIDKELNALAIANASQVYLFDYTDNYKFISAIEAANIQQVLFCQYNIIILVQEENTAYLVAYQVEDGSEIGMYEMNTGGYKALARTDNQFIYLICGIKLAKFRVPDMQPYFMVDTDHQDIIIDFNISNSAIVTSSRDRSVRVQDIETGEQCANTVEELGCDNIDTDREFIFTRIELGQGVLVWRYQQMAEDLQLLDEILLEQTGEPIIDFKMRGKIVARFSNGVNYQLLLLVTCYQDVILVNALKHKPLSEM